jgi:hypothetical protein
LPEASPEAAADPWNDWRELAKPLRIGPGGVAAAERAIDGLPDQDVVSNVCDKLKRVADDLGADADVARIAAMEAAALALCPEEAPAAKDEVAEPDEAQRTVAVAPAADDEPDDEADEEAEEAKAEAEAEADDAPEDEPDDKPEDEAAADPPTKPPD